MEITIYENEILVCESAEPNREFLLTCEHPASSYGIPVAVDSAGDPHGCDEIGPINFVAYTGRDHAGSKGLYSAAVRAGFKFVHANG